MAVAGDARATARRRTPGSREGTRGGKAECPHDEQAEFLERMRTSRLALLQAISGMSAAGSPRRWWLTEHDEHTHVIESYRQRVT